MSERTSAGRQTTPRTALNPWDYLGMLAGFLLTLLTTTVLSHGRIFWEDELLGWMLLRDPSWHHMVQAWNAGADGGGFSFYLTGRAWFRIFGPSELSFRLYSSTCFGLAFAVTWAAARRFYRTGPVAFALFTMWFFSPPVLMHMLEGRFYGLEVLSVALAVFLTFVTAASQGRTRAYIYPALFLVHGLLTTSHVLGVVFSATLVFATVAADLLQRRWRPLLYVSAAASWLLLLPERTAIAASAAVGKPHFWTTQPTLRQFISILSGSSAEIALILFLLCLAAAISLARSSGGFVPSLHQAFRQRMPVYLVLAALFAVPIAFFAEGFVGTPLMTPRYLQPLIIPLALLAMEAIQLTAPPPALRQLLASRARARLAYAACTIGLATVLLAGIFHRFRNISFSPRDYTGAINAELPARATVVCDDAFTFTEMLAQQHRAGRHYLFLLDWRGSLADTAPRVEVTQFHLMQIWQRVGYFSGSIEEKDRFLANHDDFYLLHVDHLAHPHDPPPIGSLLLSGLQQDPAYRVQLLGTLQRDNVHGEPVRFEVFRAFRTAPAATTRRR